MSKNLRRRSFSVKHRTANNLLLALTAFIWGSAFVAQSVGMDHVGPFTFNSIRSFMGGIVLLPVILILRRQSGRTNKNEKNGLLLWIGGICCGIALAAASSLQQIGLIYTSAGKAGFITAMYILIVPVMGIFIGKKAGMKTWIGVALAVAGMYFLCITDGFHMARGDFLVFLCAVIFSVHILLIDYFSPKTDGVALSCIQFFVCGILCAVPMLISERPKIAEIAGAWMPLAYAGVLSCGVGYTLQIVAQKNTDPTVASLILSLESVFSVLTGWVILGEKLSGRELFGCVLVFIAVILAQLPKKKRQAGDIS
ncbi:MAG TPA: DMT family transporter [Candidatus Mediterraneibacter intestinigallinarum]|nr:DMT family transporter [Candidatus Mediterraneibacter intestinigallinarum]